jgi:hypothetical protein
MQPRRVIPIEQQVRGDSHVAWIVMPAITFLLALGVGLIAMNGGFQDRSALLVLMVAIASISLAVYVILFVKPAVRVRSVEADTTAALTGPADLVQPPLLLDYGRPHPSKSALPFWVQLPIGFFGCIAIFVMGLRLGHGEVIMLAMAGAFILLFQRKFRWIGVGFFLCIILAVMIVLALCSGVRI